MKKSFKNILLSVLLIISVIHQAKSMQNQSILNQIYDINKHIDEIENLDSINEIDQGSLEIFRKSLERLNIELETNTQVNTQPETPTVVTVSQAPKMPLWKKIGACTAATILIASAVFGGVMLAPKPTQSSQEQIVDPGTGQCFETEGLGQIQCDDGQQCFFTDDGSLHGYIDIQSKRVFIDRGSETFEYSEEEFRKLFGEIDICSDHECSNTDTTCTHPAFATSPEFLKSLEIIGSYDADGIDEGEILFDRSNCRIYYLFNDCAEEISEDGLKTLVSNGTITNLELNIPVCDICDQCDTCPTPAPTPLVEPSCQACPQQLPSYLPGITDGITRDLTPDAISQINRLCFKIIDRTSVSTDSGCNMTGHESGMKLLSRVWHLLLG